MSQLLAKGKAKRAATPTEAGQGSAIPLGSNAEPLVDVGQALDDGAPELIEPGRALVLSDFTKPEISPTERFLRFAYRLGVPGHTLSSPFGKAPKLRLLATVESPIPGNKVAGTALRAGHFLICGVKAQISQMDFGTSAHLTPPFERTVHGFTWLRDLSALPRMLGSRPR